MAENHKCANCKYKGEYRDMKFRPFGVCLKEGNLIKAEMAYKAIECPYGMERKDAQTAELIKREDALKQIRSIPCATLEQFAFKELAESRIKLISAVSEESIRQQAIIDFVENINLPLTTDEELSEILERLGCSEEVD